MNLSSPPKIYNPDDQAQMRRALMTADGQNVKVGSDVRFIDNRAILAASDGSLWALVVSPTGDLSAVAA